jgi:DNA-binding SARP family transcriptional activator
VGSVACRLALTTEFELVMSGRYVGLPHSVERVVAYLGLASGPVHRVKLAGALWPDAPDVLAGRSLRTALWRLHQSELPIVAVHDERLELAPVIRVDLTDLLDLARRLTNAPGDDVLSRLDTLVDRAEVLPDWDDEWVVADRERFRLLRLEALERGAEALIAQAEYGRALEAALAATMTDPLRESAQRVVVRIHLAEGNVAEAVRTYGQYRELLGDEIGVEPSPAMQALVEPLALTAAS